jgi:hypothetical protein
MTLRKIATIDRTGYTQSDKPEWQERTCKVYRDNEWNEWRVILLINMHEVKGADYHTDDRQDALDTARRMALSGLCKDDNLKAFNHSTLKAIHHQIVNWDKVNPQPLRPSEQGTRRT